MKPEKLNKPEKPDKLNRPDKREKLNRLNKPNRLNRPEKPDRPDCSGPDPCRFDRHGYWLYGRDAGNANKLPVKIHSEKGPSKKVVILGGRRNERTCQNITLNHFFVRKMEVLNESMAATYIKIIGRDL